jgi:hypothetical protein
MLFSRTLVTCNTPERRENAIELEQHQRRDQGRPEVRRHWHGGLDLRNARWLATGHKRLENRQVAKVVKTDSSINHLQLLTNF